MPRYHAETAKRKVNPLVEHGHRVVISYDNPRAFEVRQVERKFGKYNEKTYTTTKSRMPTEELLNWIVSIAGPREVLWTTEKVDTGIAIFFHQPKHAMLAKLTWGGV